MTYTQITSEERYRLAAFRMQGFSQAEMARQLGRAPSTISRELARNRCAYDGHYRPSKAQERTNGRRSRSRRNQHFTEADFALVEQCLLRLWSPEQIAGRLQFGPFLRISHETIYRHIWRDHRLGGDLHLLLRGARKRRRKRYAAYDSRGRLAGKRMIGERPAVIQARTEFGHWEIDTVMGTGSKDCIMTLVERKTGWLLIGKLRDRTTAVLTDRAIDLIRQHTGAIETITADNGTEFHDYKRIEARTGVIFYFANPHHSWERGTNENTNGLIRQYLPKGTSMANLTQHQCTEIAHQINTRPRKRLDYKTPLEALYDSL